MASIIGSLLGLDAPKHRRSERVSLKDIEGQFRSITDSAQGALETSKTTALATAALGGIVLAACLYLLGRRRGRKRSSVLEIRRV
jgi:hypothetical protein